MKKLILTLSMAVMAMVVSVASPVNQVSAEKNLVYNEIISDITLASEQVTNDIRVQMSIDLDDDALDCKITITVSIGIISISGTVSGPCDEVKAQAVQLLGDLIDEAKKLAN